MKPLQNLQIQGIEQEKSQTQKRDEKINILEKEQTKYHKSWGVRKERDTLNTKRYNKEGQRKDLK